MAAHNCVREQRELPLIHSGFLAIKYLPEFRMNPKWPIPAFHKRVLHDIHIDFPPHVLRRAKRGCLRIINGTDAEQYEKLWDYRSELLKRNPNSTVEFEFESGFPSVFKRMYVCFGGLKSGFKLGCRKVIGLDGTHLKNAYKGQLLTAVGVDPNNGMYPLCYAVVEAEKLDSWAWFLDLLIKDLDMDKGFGWTLISDRQKGLLNVVQNMLPAAEHRYCVRHMHNNFKQQYKGRSLKDKLWACARAPNVEAFTSAMGFVNAESKGAYEWLTAIPPQHWTRSHFKTDVKCDILLNNMCEAFNRSILMAREQGILVMLEMIRDYLMQRLVSKRETSKKWGDKRFTPKTYELIEKFKKWTKGCYSAYSGYNQFEVTTVSGAKFAVDLNTWTCGCQRWDITGIPCHHAISCLNKLRLNVDDYMATCYSVATYNKCYSGIIFPMNGQGLWEKTGHSILPPKTIETQPGRPKRKRRPDANDVKISYEKDGVNVLTRKSQPTVRCGICREEGHNRATCPKKPATEESTTAPKKPRKRKGKKLTDEDPANEVANQVLPPQGTKLLHEGANEPLTEVANETENEERNEFVPQMNIEVPTELDNDVPNQANNNFYDPASDSQHQDCILEMNIEDDAPVVTQPTQAVEEIPQDGETELDVSARMIQELNRRKEIESHVRWLTLQADLRIARENLEARLGVEREPVDDNVGDIGSNISTKRKAEGPVRRSQRLVAQSGAQAQCTSRFKNDKESAIDLDDDEPLPAAIAATNKGKQKLKSVHPPLNTNMRKNMPPPNYIGPNLVGEEPLPPLKTFKAKVGGVVITTTSVVKDGKPVITADALVSAMVAAKRNHEQRNDDENNDNNSSSSPDK